MKKPCTSDDPLFESLRQLTPAVPAKTKSQLLYDCGMAAAETKLKKQGLGYRATAAMALSMAACFGAFLGSQFSNSAPKPNFGSNDQVANDDASFLPKHSFGQVGKPKVFAASMSLSRVNELLDQNEVSVDSSGLGNPVSAETPLSTLSFLSELE